MILCVKKLRLCLLGAGFALVLLMIIGGATKLVLVSGDDFNYRVFVAGIGTVGGKWSGNTGVAVIGLETRPASEKGLELKVIDLLLANNSSAPMVFKSSITLVNQWGERFGIKAEGHPEVIVNPGSLSQGTVIIDVRQGIPDRDWLVEIAGGNLPERILLPLRVVKIVGDTPGDSVD